MAYIEQQEAKIRDNAPSELNHLEENLFVPSEQSEVVKANLQEVGEALQQLKLRLEKVQYAYVSL